MGGFDTVRLMSPVLEYEHWLAFPQLSRQTHTFRENDLKEKKETNNSNYDRKLKRSYHVGHKLNEEQITVKGRGRMQGRRLDNV